MRAWEIKIDAEVREEVLTGDRWKGDWTRRGKKSRLFIGAVQKIRGTQEQGGDDKSITAE